MAAFFPLFASSVFAARHSRNFAHGDSRINQNPLGLDHDPFVPNLQCRFAGDVVAGPATGPSIEKSIAPLRSFVCDTINHGHLLLAGDAAHIVPPTGAKGLNSAVSDIYPGQPSK